MKKIKHNKKRNTAFLYETLIKELTKSVVEKNIEKKEKLSSLIKECFAKGTILFKELGLYRALYETQDLESKTAEKLLGEAKRIHASLNKTKLFEAQSVLIKKMNTILSKGVYSNFVPNYKSLATIYQVFNEETPVKKRILMEEGIINSLTSSTSNTKEEMKPIDNLVYNSFVEKFNKEYIGKLLPEQKNLLNKYITSFMDNGLELKIYLNEEIGKLKEELQNSINIQEISSDVEMKEKANKVLQMLDGFKSTKINKSLVQKVLKVQDLLQEIKG
jgi:hypothetical protein